MNFLFTSLRLGGLIIALTISAFTQIPAPKDTLGFTPGDDRKLASWAQVIDYFKKLDAASDRMIFEEIGKSTMGAPFAYATISSRENLKNLAKYKAINDKLADPRKIGARTLLSASPVPPAKNGLNAEAASVRTGVSALQLIKQGKTIVLITHGIHSTEVGSTLSSMLIAHRLATSNEPEIKKILDNTIILLVPSLNPDGVDIVKNWYDKTLGTPYEGTEPPELYHKYVGHDNNRDWYAFTQVETQLTVDKIHNVWHPQIVHDIHQQGSNGSRLFLPPYKDPVEPNVPKQLVEAYNELGLAMAADLRKKGYEGITTGTTYDAWTPARAYSHYHGGVRILSETASARLASPITIKFEDLRGNQDYDAKKDSDKFGPVWKGGEWKLRNITDYMTTAAFSLLNHAADNRERWLTRFYEIGKEAVRPRKDGELFGFLIPPAYGRGFDQPSWTLTGILRDAAVEIEHTTDGYLVRMDQPYGAFAKAMLERQVYPEQLDSNGNPIPPYDVTAHTLPLFIELDVRSLRSPFEYKTKPDLWFGGLLGGCPIRRNILLYKSHVPSMDEGWTRWVFDRRGPVTMKGEKPCPTYENLTNQTIRDTVVDSGKTIIFPDQSPIQILNGFPKGAMPDEYTGGVGKEGVENLKKFVEAGGTLVFLNRSTEFAIEQFNLPIRNVVKGVGRKDFYIPGSILRTELDLTHPIAKGMPKESIAWFENGPAFEIVAERVGSPTGVPAAASASGVEAVREGSTSDGDQGGALTNVRATDTAGVRIIARYPADPKQIMLSGWALGAEKIAGKAALVEVKMGKGKIVLFGFRPQYRGQSLATFPLLFNSISQ